MERNMLHKAVKGYRDFARGLTNQVLEEHEKVVGLETKVQDLQRELDELNRRRPITPGETANMEETYNEIHAAQLQDLWDRKSADDLL